MRLIWVMSVLAAFLVGSAHAAEPDWHTIAKETGASLTAAVGESGRGRPVAARLRAAITSCDRLLNSAPLSPRDRARVLHNRGVAKLETGDAGSAVLDLRRADHLAPGVAATRRELAAARVRVDKPATPAGETMAAPVLSDSEAVSVGELLKSGWDALRRVDIGGPIRWSLGLSALAAVSLLLTVRLFVHRVAIARSLAIIATGSFVVGVGSLATLAVEWQQQRDALDVVVTAEVCTPREGPDALAYPAARLNGRDTLPRGVELVVVETRADAERPDLPVWLKVHERPRTEAAVTGSTVWVAATDIAWVASPR